MTMVCLAILALLAGPGDRSPARHEAGPGPSAPIARRSAPATPSPSKAVGRRPCRGRDGVPSPGVCSEDCDTEEGVDETWLLHLDALGAEPVARLDWARPRSEDGPDRPGQPDAPALSPFPLRC